MAEKDGKPSFFGKNSQKVKKALTEKGGGDNITEHAAESCEPDL